MGTSPVSCIAQVVAVTLFLGLPALAQLPPPLERPGAHFLVQFHAGPSPAPIAARLADESIAAAESAWPKIEELLAPRAWKPATLHVYSEVAEYRAVEQKHRAGQLPLESFALLQAAEAHLLLWPCLSKQALQLVGLPEPTRQAIICRAAQLVAAQVQPAAVRDAWLADVFAYAVLESMVNPRHQFGLEPAYDTRRSFLFQCMEERRESTLKGSVFRFEEPKTRRDSDDDEEAKCIMAQVMAATGTGWAKKLLAKPNKKNTARADTRFAAVEATLGSEWSKIEGRFIKMCQTVKPVWKQNEPMTAVRDKRLLMAGSTETTASFHAVQLPQKLGYVIRGKFELVPCGEESCRIQLDWDGKSMVSCFFGVGRYQIKRWEVGADWVPLLEGFAPIKAGKSFEAAVEVGATVRMLVDGEEVVSWPYGDRKMLGRWSMAANDCVVWIESLRIEPLVPAKK